MRRVAVAAVAVVSWLSLALTWPGEAMAQGFFESLFGGGQQQAAPPAPMGMPPPLYGHRLPSSPQQRDRGEGKSEQSQKSGSGRYRTLCVRTCDGYYFPISNATTRQGFYKDAKICKASCGEEAKLYFVDKSDTDASDMADISGRPYTRLQTAFLYRKRQVEGCKCKPEPWQQSELDRHRAYADASAAGKEDAKRKVQLGPSDPAVRAVFDRQEQGTGTAGATAEAQAGAIASETGGKPANDTPASDSEPTTENRATTGDNDNSKTPASPASEPQKSTPKSKPPSVKPDKRAPYHAGAPGGSRAPLVPASAQPGYASQPAPKPLFGLGGPNQRWPGE